MRIVDFRNSTILTRYSLIRLREETILDNISIQRVDKFLRNIDRETFRVSQEIIRADRCIKFIEGINNRHLLVDNEDIVITLLTLYSHDMMRESVLKVGFKHELESLSGILKDNILNKRNPFLSSKFVTDNVVYCNLIKSNLLASIYLITNLMIVRSGQMIILEDTDMISSDLVLNMQMVVERCIK